MATGAALPTVFSIAKFFETVFHPVCCLQFNIHAVSTSDAVDGSSTGIAMCQIAVVIQELRMSANGY